MIAKRVQQVTSLAFCYQMYLLLLRLFNLLHVFMLVLNILNVLVWPRLLIYEVSTLNRWHWFHSYIKESCLRGN